MVTQVPEIDHQRLVEAIRWSREKLEPFRRNHLNGVREFVGKHYGDSGTKGRKPINMIKLAVTIYVRQLIARNPRYMINSKVRDLRPYAAGMEQEINRRVQQLHLDEVMAEASMNSMFSIGILKVGLAVVGQIEYEGAIYANTEPFVDSIDLDDWVHDMSAKSLRRAWFMGHRFEAPIDLVKAHKGFDPAVAERLSETTDTSQTNESGDPRISSLSQPAGASGKSRYRPMTQLLEVYLPRERVTITYPWSSSQAGPDSKPLSVVPFVGPPCGQYHFLKYSDVPGNSMPSPPVSDMMDLDSIINRVYTKVSRQAERQKTILAVGGSAGKDGKTVVATEDGEAVTVNNPDMMKEMRFGGPDQQNLLFVTQARQQFTYLANNLDALGGLATGADTLGQDQMLTANASKTIQAWQADTVKCARSVGQALLWFYWTDPFQTYHTQVPNRRMPEITADVPISPDVRQKYDPALLDFDVDPYSLQDRSPAQIVQSIQALVQQFILPAGPALAQQGIGINFEGLIKTVARYMRINDLEDFVVFQEMLQQAQEQAGPQQQQPGKPATTNRTYTRVNRPGQTSGAQDAMMMQAMMHGNPGGGGGGS